MGLVVFCAMYYLVDTRTAVVGRMTEYVGFFRSILAL